MKEDETMKKHKCRECGRRVNNEDYDEFYDMCVDCVDTMDAQADIDDYNDNIRNGLNDGQGGPWITYIGGD